jgi:hypothetical protein
MGDNLKEKGTPDSKRINIEEQHEITYWTKELGVSEERLKEAVEKAGTSVQAVREFLKK